MSKVLVLAAHPDDEVLGVGGTIARLSAEGHEVNIAILATGLTSRGRTTRTQLQALQDQAVAAAKVLGVHSAGVSDFPDNQMDSMPLLNVTQHIEDLLNRYQPDVVYTHYEWDLNQDHRAIAHATLIATRPAPGCSVKGVYTYEVPSSTEWAFCSQSQFCPNVFTDISGEYLEKKLQAMAMYETEAREFPHPRSAEALRALAMWRGATAGVQAAEAFQLVRSIR